MSQFSTVAEPTQAERDFASPAAPPPPVAPAADEPPNFFRRLREKQEAADAEAAACPPALPLDLSACNDTQWQFRNARVILGDVSQSGTLQPMQPRRGPGYALGLALQLESAAVQGAALEARRKAIAAHAQVLMLAALRQAPEHARVAELIPIENAARRARDAALARVKMLRARAEYLQTISPPPRDLATQLLAHGPELHHAEAELRDRESELGALAPLYGRAFEALKAVAQDTIARVRREVIASEKAELARRAEALVAGLGEQLTAIGLIGATLAPAEERSPDRVLRLLDAELRAAAEATETTPEE